MECNNQEVDSEEKSEVEEYTVDESISEKMVALKYEKAILLKEKKSFEQRLASAEKRLQKLTQQNGAASERVRKLTDENVILLESLNFFGINETQKKENDLQLQHQRSIQKLKDTINSLERQILEIQDDLSMERRFTAQYSTKNEDLLSRTRISRRAIKF